MWGGHCFRFNTAISDQWYVEQISWGQRGKKRHFHEKSRDASVRGFRRFVVPDERWGCPAADGGPLSITAEKSINTDSNMYSPIIWLLQGNMAFHRSAKTLKPPGQSEEHRPCRYSAVSCWGPPNDTNRSQTSSFPSPLWEIHCVSVCVCAQELLSNSRSCHGDEARLRNNPLWRNVCGPRRWITRCSIILVLIISNKSIATP